MQIKFFTTGGTFDKIYFDQKSSFEVGDSSVGSLLLLANVAFEYEIEEILRKDSLDLSDDDRCLIVERVAACEAERVVITHGTDTMALTGKSLLVVPQKTIVLTGAMQPARFHDSDAFFNLGTAVAAVQTLPHGVYLAMNGMIFDPKTGRKNVAANRFESS